MRFQQLTKLAHGGFIMLILISSIIISQNIDLEIPGQFAISIIHFILVMLLFYVHLEILIPRYLDRQRFLMYMISVLLSTTSIILISQLADKIIFTSFEAQWPGYFQIVKLQQVLFSHLMILLFAYPFKLANQWHQRRQLLQQMQAHRHSAELKFLKEQVNPHFLLNVLNNAYSLTVMEDVQAGATIQKLRNMMEYMLINCQKTKIPLDQELDFLNNFLELQQLKKDHELNINFEQHGGFESIEVEPLLFIPFFENAFKHGNLDDIQKGFLNSKIQLLERKLYFEIENSIGNTSPIDYKKGGIGLTNIKQRLELLYPKKHRLHYTKSKNLFRVEMELSFTSLHKLKL